MSLEKQFHYLVRSLWQEWSDPSKRVRVRAKRDVKSQRRTRIIRRNRKYIQPSQREGRSDASQRISKPGRSLGMMGSKNMNGYKLRVVHAKIPWRTGPIRRVHKRYPSLLHTSASLITNIVEANSRQAKKTTMELVHGPLAS